MMTRVAVLALLVLAACSSRAPSSEPTIPPTTTSTPVASAEPSYADPKTDNLMKGYNDHDYVTFSRDFDDQMRAAFTKEKFEGEFQTTIVEKIGDYVSRTLVGSDTTTKGYVAFVFDTKFTNDEPVKMRVVFDDDAGRRIAGLFFDSAKLRA